MVSYFRSSPPEVFLGKDVLKICGKFTGEYPCRSEISIKLPCRGVISIKLVSNFIEITLWHGYTPVNLLHIFRTPLQEQLWRAASVTLFSETLCRTQAEINTSTISHVVMPLWNFMLWNFDFAKKNISLISIIKIWLPLK